MSTTMKATANRLAPITWIPGKTLVARLMELQAIRNERRRLAAMDAAQLADVGISAREALAESKRAAWDAPERWLR